MTSTTPTAAQLREHLGEQFCVARWRTPLEVAAYRGQEAEVGSGILVGVCMHPVILEFDGQIEDLGVIPHVLADYGMCWAILPGIVVTFGDDVEARNVLLREVSQP